MKKITTLLFFAVLTLQGNAQISLGPSIAGTQSDINYLASGYLGPFGEGLAFGLTNGWYNTAKVKKTFRFEIGFTPSLTLMPSESQSFIIDPAELQELELVDPNNAETPTVFGEDAPGVALQYSEPALQGLANSSFNMPAGLGYAIAPMMTLQAGIGLPFDFELSGRYLPSTAIPLLEGSEIGLWGLGLKHDLTRYIPGGKAIPFSISAFASYTQFDLGQDIEPNANNDKRIDVTANALVTRILVSKKVLFITFYGGVGYNYLNSGIKVSGTYEYINPGDLLNPEQTITDPVDISSTGGSGLAANLGVRFKFLMLGYVSADYTFGTFNAANLSLGISWDL
jgi:hypothetical protein